MAWKSRKTARLDEQMTPKDKYLSVGFEARGRLALLLVFKYLRSAKLFLN